MSQEKQRIVIVGLSYFGQQLIRNLSSTWDMVVLDKNNDTIMRTREEFPDEEYICGAADSLVTWKKIDLSSFKYIISTLKETEINLEMCRILRETLTLKIPVIILNFRKVDETLFEKYHVTLLNPLNPAIQAVAKKMDKNLIYAVNMGLEKGELLEVAIRAKSHLVDRELKQLRPAMWHISAIYRDNTLILPSGSSSLKIGDRAVLVGDPKILENVTNILLKGDPQFPLQYGTDIITPLHSQYQPTIDESLYWLNTFKAVRIQFLPFKEKNAAERFNQIKTDDRRFKTGPQIEMFKEIFNLSLNTGVLTVPMTRYWFKNIPIRECFKKSQKPFLISRLSYPYEGVTISFNGPEPGKAMEAGLEISKLLNVPFRVIYVTLPKEMMGREDMNDLSLRRLIISDFEGIYKKRIDFSILEGNPVRETLKFLSPLKKELLVITSNPKASLSMFKPNPPYLIAKNSHLSTLVLPEGSPDE